MVTFAYSLAIIFMVLLPLIFSFTLVRRYGTAWMIFMMGGLAFLVAEIAGPQVITWISGTDFYTAINTSWINQILFYALLLTLFQNAARYGALRLAGPPSKTWGGGVTISAGFAVLNLVLVFGLNALMTLVLVSTYPSTIPDGTTAAEFAAAQQQIHDFWSASFLSAFVQTQLIPGMAQFSLQIVVGMVMWIGVVHKKWLWVFTAFFFEFAMTALYSMLGNWIGLYTFSAQDYSINVPVGCAIFVALMAFNVGILYVIAKNLGPLTPAVVVEKAKPAPSKQAASKPAQNTLAPREKAIPEVKPGKKLKNTDLK